MKPQRILNFRVLKYIKTFIILFVSLVMFMALGKFFNKVFFKVTYLFYGLIGVYFLILMINIIKYLLVFAKYKKKDMLNDLLNPLTKRYEKCHTYTGPAFIICNHVNLLVHRYTELVWIYPDDEYTRILGYTVKDKFVTVCNLDKKETCDEIMKDIWNKNPNILLGMDDETRKKYNRIRKGPHKK